MRRYESDFFATGSHGSQHPITFVIFCLLQVSLGSACTHRRDLKSVESKEARIIGNLAALPTTSRQSNVGGHGADTLGRDSPSIFDYL